MTTATAEPASVSLKTTKKRIADLIPADYNPNEMTDADLRALDASMSEFGYVEAVVWNKRSGRIVSGHQRVRCLKGRGINALDVVEVDLSDEDERTLNVAMNSISGEQEANKLAAVLQSLSDDRRALAGWDEDAFNELLSRTHEHLTQGKKDANAVPDKVRKRVKAGDVWLLGDHRLLCGDSLTELDALMPDNELADCVFTSPPYGIGIDYGNGYKDSFANVCALIKRLPDALAPHVVEGGFIVVNFADVCSATQTAGEYPMALVYYPAFNDQGWALWSRRVWCKPTQAVFLGAACRTNRAVRDTEHLWTFKRRAERKAIRRGTKGEFNSQHGWIDTSKEAAPEADRTDKGPRFDAAPSGKLGRPREKTTQTAGMPVSVAQFSIAVHSRKQGVVLEPFAGTGTTLIAAAQLQRVCFAVEQNPALCDIALARWESFTGGKAVKS